MNADLRARVLAEAKRMPSPTRTEHRKRTTWILGLGVAAAAAVFVAWGPCRPGARPAELIVFYTGLAFAFALNLTRLGMPARRSMLPRPATTLVGVTLATAPLLALCAVAAAAMWPALADEPVSSGATVSCAAITFAQGALPLAVLLVPWRSADPVHPTITGAALGTAAGAWAATMAYLRCPHAASMHCVVAHVAPMIVFAVVGAVVGRALLRIR